MIRFFPILQVRENVKTTIKASQAILTISSIYIYRLRDLIYYQVYIEYTKIYYSIQYSYLFLYREGKKSNICCFLSPANFPIITTTKKGHIAIQISSQTTKKSDSENPQFRTRIPRKLLSLCETPTFAPVQSQPVHNSRN
jgi:hypothetical protein